MPKHNGNGGISLVSSPNAGELRRCFECHFSWNLPPTNKEVKEGVVDSLQYCCEVRARATLPDGVFPLLVTVARERKDLCGPTGKWWAPIKDVTSVQDVANKNYRGMYGVRKDTRKRDSQGRVVREHSRETVAVSAASSGAPARKPYKVR